MDVCDYIDLVYTQITNTYLGIPIDYTVLEDAITSDIIAATELTTTVPSTNTCTITLNPNTCNLSITLT